MIFKNASENSLIADASLSMVDERDKIKNTIKLIPQEDISLVEHQLTHALSWAK